VLAFALMLLHAAPAFAAPTLTVAPSVSGTTVDGETLTANDGSWTGAGVDPVTTSRQWQRCFTICQDIVGGTDPTYELTGDDIGATIQIVVTATDPADAGTDTATSAAVGPVQAAPPVNTTLPTVTGTTRVGQQLTANTGQSDWDGSGPFTFSYQWQRCTSPSVCTAIGAPDSDTYTLTTADFERTIRVVVTASNGHSQSGQATSAETAQVVSAPFNTVAPQITPTGTIRDGQTLTASTGTWDGTDPIDFTFQWRRCNASGASCSNIGSPTIQNTLQLTPSDVNSTIRVRVIANNAHGSANVETNQTAVVQKAPPVNESSPTVTGTPEVGEQLTANTEQGDWTGTGPFTFSYQWERCSPGCTPIPTATSSTYTLTDDDFGNGANTVRVSVTASNNPNGGTFTAASAQTDVIQSDPINTAAPTIGGIARNGQTLTAGNGQWKGTGEITFSYDWQRCDAPNTGCVDVGGTDASYTPGAADFEKVIRLEVTATNSLGSVSQAVHSAAVDSAPFNTSAPTVNDPTGAPLRDRDELTVDEGTWDGTGGEPSFAYSYQWESCNPAPTCDPIPGATGPTYRLRPADVDKAVRVRVSAANSVGSFPAVVSAATGTVQGIPVTNIGPPAAEGTTMDGEELVATDGLWEGSILGFRFQWKRCDASGAGCTDIPGALNRRYRLTPFDVGSRLMVTVTADVAGGTDQTDDSPVTAQVVARPPGNVIAPSISGPARVGRALTASDGQWVGTGISLSRNWLRCGGGGCTDTGATGPTYDVTGADRGSVIVLRVTATGTGSATADSAPTATVSDNAAPTPTFVYHPRTPTTSDTIALTSTSGDSDGAIVSQTWDTDDDGRFDDGSGVEASVRFRTAGRHEVALRVVDNEGAANTVTRTINVRRPDRLISPFPVVRIVGGGTARGARIRTLIVRAPKGAKVMVRCKGRCPARRQAKAIKSGSARFKRFERSLVAGTVLEVLVTQTDRIGKFTRFKIRRGRAPQRTDRCLMPGSTKPTTCPGG
jgi:PKD domain-containing protein